MLIEKKDGSAAKCGEEGSSSHSRVGGRGRERGGEGRGRRRIL